MESSLAGVSEARELFWQNVMREILTSLSVISTAGLQATDTEKASEPGQNELFDGRLAVITDLGQRIPIAAVFPLFACGISLSDVDKELSMAVECTVFQIKTPGGEVFTLPLHEIRSFHSLSEELIEQIRKQAAQQTDGDEEQEPFGFAAYTSLARTKLPGEVVGTGSNDSSDADDEPEGSPD
jgi:hypothetical protein